MKKDDNNKEKINASELLSKLRPYLQDQKILEEKKDEEINHDSVPETDDNIEWLVQEDNKNLELIKQEHSEDVYELEQFISEETDNISEYLAHEAELLHDNIGDDEYNLMSIFGVDNDTEDNDEYEEPDPVKKPIEEIDFKSKKQKKIAFIKQKKRFAGALAGFFATAVLLLVCLVIEGATVFEMNLPALVDIKNYTQIALLMSVQVMILAVAFQYKLFFRSLKQLFSGKFGAGSVLVVYTFVFALYYLLLMVFGVKTDVITYNSVLLLAALFSLVAELLETSSMVYNLKIASSDKNKYVLVELDKKQSRDARELVGKYLLPDTPYLASAETLNVNDFNKRSAATTEKRKIIGFFLTLSLIMTVIFALYALYKEGFHSSLKFAINGFLFVMPISVSLVFSLPVFSQNKKLAHYGATVIGEKSFEQYKTPACLIMEDKDIFSGDGRVQLNGIQGYGDARIDLALGYAAAIFSKLDCPLGQVFAKTASDYNVSTDVDIAFVDDDGIEGAVEGSSVLVGTYNFIKKHNVLPHKETDAYETDDCYIYIVVDKQTALRVQLGYFPSAQFVRTLKTLMKKDVNIIIKTCDPNINMDLLERLTGINLVMPIRILRIKNVEMAKYDFSKECSSGIITVSGLRSLAKTFAGSTRVCSAMRAGMVFSVISMIAAFVVMFVIALASGCSGVSSLFIVAYQLFWVLPVIAIDKLLL